MACTSAQHLIFKSMCFHVFSFGRFRHLTSFSLHLCVSKTNINFRLSETRYSIWCILSGFELVLVYFVYLPQWQKCRPVVRHRFALPLQEIVFLGSHYLVYFSYRPLLFLHFDFIFLFILLLFPFFLLLLHANQKLVENAKNGSTCHDMVCALTACALSLQAM